MRYRQSCFYYSKQSNIRLPCPSRIRQNMRSSSEERTRCIVCIENTRLLPCWMGLSLPPVRTGESTTWRLSWCVSSLYLPSSTFSLSPNFISQNYRQGSYQTAFDLYNDLLDSAETVRPDTFHSLYSFGIHPSASIAIR